MYKFSGNKDIDMLILMKLDDKNLSVVSTVNKYIHTVCDSDNFLNMRIRLLFNITENELHELRSYLGLDAKELYIYLVSIDKMKKKYTRLLIQILLRYQDYVNKVIEQTLNKTLPKYINREELTYYLRGHIAKTIFIYKIDNMVYPSYFDKYEFYTKDLSIASPFNKKVLIPYFEDMTVFMNKYMENFKN